MLESSRPRSSSIPRSYHRIRVDNGRFAEADAGELGRKLRALDGLLSSVPPSQHRDLSFGSILSSSDNDQILSDSDGDASRDLFELLDGFPRPDLIPATFLEAYTAALLGRPFLNEYRCTDFKKGRDPTCSEVLRILPRIDAVVDTNLSAAFNAANDTVPSFPFLRLPAELRLQCYAHLLPRPTHLSLFDHQNRARKAPRTTFAILRTCRQLHDEVSKYFYDKQVLFQKLVCPFPTSIRHAIHLALDYETVAGMGARTRLYFKRLEVQVDCVPNRSVNIPPYSAVPRVEDSWGEMLKLLPSLETVVVSFPPHSRETARMLHKRRAPVNWLIDQIPDRMQLLWDFRHWQDEEGERLVAERMQLGWRGGLQHGESVLRVT